jgi:hypothetical protein
MMRALTVALLAATVACDRDTPAARTDSAGVAIVHTTKPAWEGNSAWRVGELMIFVGSGEGYEVLAYTRDGKLARKQRTTSEDLSVTQADLDRHVAAQLEGATPERRPAIEREYAEMPQRSRNDLPRAAAR